MFWDVCRRTSYDQFIEQTQREKPYRDSNKAYPLGDRKYSSRHFRVRDNGSIDIYYITRESQDAYERGEEVRTNYETWHKRRKLATVHPDNTVEFHHTSGQGDHGLLSRLFGCWMYQSSKHGGVVLQTGDRKKHPVFKGQKFKLGSLECVTPYEIYQRRVNRKSAAEAMQKYKEFLQVGKAMTLAMDHRGLQETGSDLMKLINRDSPEGQHPHYRLSYNSLEPLFFDLIEKKHYVDAAVLFSINFNVNGARWRLTNETEYTNSDHWMENYHMRLFPKIATSLHKEVCYHHNAFNMKQCEMGELSASKWRSLVLVDGKPVVRL